MQHVPTTMESSLVASHQGFFEYNSALQKLLGSLHRSLGATTRAADTGRDARVSSLARSRVAASPLKPAPHDEVQISASLPSWTSHPFSSQSSEQQVARPPGVSSFRGSRMAATAQNRWCALARDASVSCVLSPAG